MRDNSNDYGKKFYSKTLRNDKNKISIHFELQTKVCSNDLMA